MRKRWVSGLLVIMFCLSLLPGTAGATDVGVGGWEPGEAPETSGEWTANGNYDTSWYNTTDNNFILYDSADLAGLAFIVNNSTRQPAVAEQEGTSRSTLTVQTPYDNFYGKTITLASNGTFNLSGKSWTPIGKNVNASFQGTFNGSNQTISNLIINEKNTGTYVGLFGYVYNDGVVKNLNVTNADIRIAVDNSSGTVGGIVGYNWGGTISHCTFSGQIVVTTTTYGHVGGIAGCNQSNQNIVASVENCTNNANISSSVGTVGGIVGSNGVYGSTGSNNQESVGNIKSCTNTGNILHSTYSAQTYAALAGGIAGRSSGTVETCKNTGIVTGQATNLGGILGYLTASNGGNKGQVINCENSGSVTGNYTGPTGQCVGGIVGIFSNGITSTSTKIEKCSNSGAIGAASQNSRIGGILGGATGSNTTLNIVQCANTGNISGITNSTSVLNVSVGGIAGYVNTKTSCTITESYNTGTIVNNSSSTSNTTCTGGLIGYLHSQTGTLDFSNCYNVGNVTGHSYVGGLVGNASAAQSSTANPKITACYNAGTVAGTTVIGGAFGSVSSLDVTGCSYWVGCGKDGQGISKSANAMTDNTNWDTNLGLDKSTWEKSNNPGGSDMTGYLPVLTNNKQNPPPELTRTTLLAQTLTINNKPTGENGTLSVDHDDFTLTATSDQSGSGDITWKSSDSNVATVDYSGKVILRGVGKVTIIATKAADDQYDSASASYTFTVTKQITAITINDLGALTAGTTIATNASAPSDACYRVLEPMSIGSPGYNITWTEDGYSLSGDKNTFTAGKTYVGTLTMDSDEYYSFANKITVNLDGAKSKYATTTKQETNGTLTVTITFTAEKETVNITDVTATSGLVYNGQSQQGYTGTPSSAYNGEYNISYSGTTTNNETYGPAETPPTDAGSYTVTISIPDSDPSYSGSTTINFTIGKAPLTIKATDKTAYVGSTAPDLSDPVEDTDYTVSGLVGNDTLTTKPTLSHTADMSKADTYAITPSNADAGSNYEITYVEGTLTVTPAPSSGSTRYRVTVEEAEGGSVVSSATRARRGTTVTLTVTPEEGYALSALSVTDRNGKTLSLTQQGGGKYTFVMPASPVTVSAAFAPAAPAPADCPKDETCPIAPFPDASPKAWYHDGVHFCLDQGLMVGFADGTFRPDGDTSRAMVATILWRQAGCPEETTPLPFSDVAEDAWYAPAVRWAAAQGVVTGTSPTTFDPDQAITREQLAAMLWRAAGRPESSRSLVSFPDAGQISPYALPSLAWANETGLILGQDTGLLAPASHATRAETAQVFQRLVTGVL